MTAHTSFTLPALLVALLFSVIGNAQGADGEIPRDRFRLRLGIQTFSDFGTTMRVDSDRLGFGSELSLERDLALEQRISVLRTEFDIRFARRHGMTVSHYDVARDGRRDLSAEIQFGDEVYEIGTSVITGFDEELFKIAYRYRFLDRPSAVLDGIAGIHATEFRASLSTVDSTQVTVHSADAPLPVLGLSGAYQFAQRWRLTGAAEFFKAQAGELRGRFRDVRAAVEHDTFNNAGFGMGLNRVVLDFDIHKADRTGLVALTFNAGVVYIFGNFGRVN